MVDSHAHLDSPKYDADREAVLQRALQQGVDTILSIGIGEGPETMQGALDLARRYAGRPDVPRLFASAGIHPHEAQFANEAALAKLDALLAEPEIIAAGEIGLDYYYDHSPRDRQRLAFLQQMEIAAARKCPIVIHCRPSEGSNDAWEDMLSAVESHWAKTGLGGILHCFTGEWSHAQSAMNMGFLISFAGNVTFAKAEGIRRVAAQVPLDHLLIETDAPFLAPVPYRGRRNESAWVPAVAAKLAEVRATDPDAIAAETAQNFFGFFGLTFPAAGPA